jgi:hypothetical protein
MHASRAGRSGPLRVLRRDHRRRVRAPSPNDPRPAPASAGPADVSEEPLARRPHQSKPMRGPGRKRARDQPEAGALSVSFGYAAQTLHLPNGETDMATADFLDQKRQEIAARLNELRPLVDEYQRLEAAAAALDGVSATSLMHATPATRRPAAPAEPKRSRSSRRTPASRSLRSPKRWASSRTTCTACSPASPTTDSSSKTAVAGNPKTPHNDPPRSQSSRAPDPQRSWRPSPQRLPTRPREAPSTTTWRGR